MDTVKAGAVFVITTSLCVAASLRLAKCRFKLLILLPSLMCLMGAAVCFVLSEGPFTFTYSERYAIIIWGIDFSAAFFVGAITVFFYFLKLKLPPGKRH